MRLFNEHDCVPIGSVLVLVGDSPTVRHKKSTKTTARPLVGFNGTNVIWGDEIEITPINLPVVIIDEPSM
ncbi:MAG TPA: hypothetical protein ENI66_01235 [Candidatus Yonathbacteria bacterium]|nr:hypothetical protein [Candidatus Yonathbacteria bacterium]